MVFLDNKFLLLLDKFRLSLEIGNLIAVCEFLGLPADRRLFVHEGQGSFELGDGSLRFLVLGALLRDLFVDGGDLGNLLLRLRDHGGTSSSHLPLGRINWRSKVDQTAASFDPGT